MSLLGRPASQGNDKERRNNLKASSKTTIDRYHVGDSVKPVPVSSESEMGYHKVFGSIISHALKMYGFPQKVYWQITLPDEMVIQ
jgi:hypothetical protein